MLDFDYETHYDVLPLPHDDEQRFLHSHIYSVLQHFDFICALADCRDCTRPIRADNVPSKAIRIAVSCNFCTSLQGLKHLTVTSHRLYCSIATSTYRTGLPRTSIARAATSIAHSIQPGASILWQKSEVDLLQENQTIHYGNSPVHIRAGALSLCVGEADNELGGADIFKSDEGSCISRRRDEESSILHNSSTSRT